MKTRLSARELADIWRIIAVYAVFSCIWIYWSDHLLAAMVADPDTRTTFSVYKGIIFILISSFGVLLPLLARHARQRKAAEEMSRQQQERLQQSEARFRLIADSMPNLVWVALPDGTIEYVNRAFREYTGLEEYDPNLSFVHPDDRERTVKVWLDSLRSGVPYAIEHRFRRYDGVYRWYLCRAIPVADATGTIVRWYGTSTDIHDLKSAFDRIASILDSMSDGFIAIDEEWVVTYFNRKAEEMSGIKPSDVLGRNYWEVSADLLGTSVETGYRVAMQEKRTTHFSHYFERYRRLLEVYVHPYADGIAIFLQDLTERERAAAELRSRTAELESLLQHAPIGFAFFDREHCFLRVNKVLAEMSGVPADECLGRRVGEVLPAVPVDPLLDRVFTTGESVEEEVSGETPQDPGVTRHWLSGFFPVVVSAGNPAAVGSYVVDITDRKRMEDALARLAAIVQGAEDAIFSEDLNGVIQTWNRGAERLFGYGAEEAVGRHVSFLVPPEHAGELADMSRKMREGLQDQFETVRVTKSGRRRDVFLSMSPIRNAAGEVVGVSKILHDITHRKIVERHLQETVRALERSNRDLRQFAHVAAHDLQEPLRNVTRYVELFARKYHDAVDDQAEHYIRFVTEGARRLHDLIRDLLVYSEVGAQMAEFRAVAMGDVAEEAIRPFRRLLDETKGRIDVGPLPEVHGDRSQLVQLIHNLLSNALKFRREGVTPQVRISAVRTSREWLFEVRDNGIGIPVEFVEKVFVIFQRLQSRSEFPGTGVGLAICRKIVEWHGGRIWVEPRDEGTSFFFTIPVRGEAT